MKDSVAITEKDDRQSSLLHPVPIFQKPVRLFKNFFNLVHLFILEVLSFWLYGN